VLDATAKGDGDVNAVDDVGRPALHLLAISQNGYAEGGRGECARLLVEAGVDVNVKDGQGKLAVELLGEEERDREMKAVLLESGGE
jgi:ankyrin repeat protein